MLSRNALALTLVLACSCATSGPATRDGVLVERFSHGERWTSRLIDPVSAPTTFETPLIHTSLNALTLRQQLPNDSIFEGGDFQVYALQARLALSERFALIATKDGYIDLDPDAGADEDGLADIAAGFKYALVDDPENGVLVTPGLILELPSGDKEVFQGNGDGVLRPFVSAGWDRDEFNFLGAVGYNHPLDDNEESASIDYHLHVDYEATSQLYPLAEINGISYVSDGNALPVNFEGGDLINLGAGNVSGNTVITGAVGTRFKANDRVLFGLTYEWPLTSREDLFDDRVTLDLLLLL